jgi:hypothetical protein
LRWLGWLSTKLDEQHQTFWLSDRTLTTARGWVLKWVAGPAIGLLGAIVYLVIHGGGTDLSTLLAVVGFVICPEMGLHSVGVGLRRFLRIHPLRLWTTPWWRGAVPRGVGLGTACFIVTGLLPATLPSAAPIPLWVAGVCSALVGITLAARTTTALRLPGRPKDGSSPDLLDRSPLLSSVEYQGETPTALITDAKIAGLIFGPLYALVVGGFFSQFVGWWIGMFWAFLWLMIGGHGGLIRHLLWRHREHRRNRAPEPRGLVEWLDWAVNRNLLVRDGAGLTFPHLTAWKYVIENHAPEDSRAV